MPNEDECTHRQAGPRADEHDHRTPVMVLICSADSRAAATARCRASLAAAGSCAGVDAPLSASRLFDRAAPPAPCCPSRSRRRLCANLGSAAACREEVGVSWESHNHPYLETYPRTLQVEMVAMDMATAAGTEPC
jgi:hypothetical protein